jgi:tetratricopeptide (TPR) repeat protein
VLTKDVPQATAPPPAEIEEELDEETRKLLKNPKKLFELGETMLEHEELEKAIVCFHFASQAKPKWSAPYLKLGYTYFNLGKDKEAVENFKKFLELNPKSPEAPTIKELIEILKED